MTSLRATTLHEHLAFQAGGPGNDADAGSFLETQLPSMPGLGLGIDYALPMVSLFREALANGHSLAALIASRYAGDWNWWPGGVAGAAVSNQ
jgi:hypothetical protein